MSNRQVLSGFAVLLLLPCALGAEDFVAEALRRPILAEGQPMAEVQDYCEERIPRVPDFENLDAWQAFSDAKRTETLDRIIFQGEAAAWRDAETRVEWLEEVEGGPGYVIKKLRYEALPGLWIPALLYEPETLEGKVPVVLNVNGHDGNGKAADYKQVRCINLAKRGMLALNLEWIGMGQLRGEGFRHGLINAIDLCGTSGISTHYLAMSRAIDLILEHEHADPERLAVTGLSGGGWQTIFISALDPRVTLSNPVAGYSSFGTRVRHLSDLGDSEQTPNDLATVVDYNHLTAMLAPRPTLLTYNAKDNCCFASGHALPPLLEAAGPIFELYGKADHLRSHINEDPGDHNYQLDNRQAFYRMIGAFFFPDDNGFDAEEIPSDSEIKTDEELHVELPGDNLDLQKLALGLSRDLPKRSGSPQDETAADDWRTERVNVLRDILRYPACDLEAEAIDEQEEGGTRAVAWRFKINETWTVPAVELTRGEPSKTVILVNDAGRAEAVDQVETLLDQGCRVLAVDPFYIGESHIAQRDYLFCLLLTTIGDRPLGLQTGQLAAIARWSNEQWEEEQGVAIVSNGPRTGVMALTAAVIEPKSIQGVERREAWASLKELLTQGMIYNDAPELFCFGLLEQFDLADLEALLAQDTAKDAD